MKKLILLHGLPGSGKSYLIQLLLRIKYGNVPYAIVSADLFWGPNYNWNPKFLSYAHNWCKMNCAYNMNLGTELILVDNTNLTVKECQPYVDLCKEFGYNWDIEETKTEWSLDPQECFKRNTHNVPLDTIQNMLNRKQSITEIKELLE